MNALIPLFAFIAIMLLFAATLIWFARTADVGDALKEHAKLYVRPYVKATTLISISFLSTFIDQLRKLTPETANAMQWYDWAAMYFVPVVAALAVLAAFLDKSISEVQAHPPMTAAEHANPPPAAAMTEAEHFARIPERPESVKEQTPSP